MMAYWAPDLCRVAMAAPREPEQEVEEALDDAIEHDQMDRFECFAGETQESERIDENYRMAYLGGSTLMHPPSWLVDKQRPQRTRPIAHARGTDHEGDVW